MGIHGVSRHLVVGSAMVLAAGLAVSAYPSVFQVGLAVSRPGVQPGYVIFGAPDGNSYAIDVKGNVAKKWPSPVPNTQLGYTRPLANGNLLSRVQPPRSLSGAEGANAEVTGATSVIEATQDGRIVWQYTDQVRSLHHDMERMPNGNTLLVCSKDLNLPQISRRLLKDDCLIEVDPSGNVVWEWQTADHLDDLELPQEVKDQIMNGYPGGRRTGVGGAPPPTKGFDYLHMNAASPIPDSAGPTDPRFKPGNIIVSYRYINTLAVVDRETKKIVWKTVGLTIGQHNPHFISDGVPGTGHVLVFDNGFVNGTTNPYRISTREYSRVVEIDPVDTSIVWEYTAEKSNRPIWTFFSHYISGAQRQSNGNTLICEGSNGRIFEVTPSGEIVWEYVNPFQNLTGTIPNTTIFRATKVAESWLKR
ncbi:aryl-sulfate sulfotransferase [bacterium AH-315-O15]|nr:aryl-sulfate sulfotransferase [bacterium AH-315-O15]